MLYSQFVNRHEPFTNLIYDNTNGNSFWFLVRDTCSNIYILLLLNYLSNYLMAMLVKANLKE